MTIRQEWSPDIKIWIRYFFRFSHYRRKLANIILTPLMQRLLTESFFCNKAHTNETTQSNPCQGSILGEYHCQIRIDIKKFQENSTNAYFLLSVVPFVITALDFLRCPCPVGGIASQAAFIRECLSLHPQTELYSQRSPDCRHHCPAFAASIRLPPLNRKQNHIFAVRIFSANSSHFGCLGFWTTVQNELFNI